MSNNDQIIYDEIKRTQGILRKQSLAQDEYHANMLYVNTFGKRFVDKCVINEPCDVFTRTRYIRIEDNPIGWRLIVLKYQADGQFKETEWYYNFGPKTSQFILHGCQFTMKEHSTSTKLFKLKDEFQICSNIHCGTYDGKIEGCCDHEYTIYKSTGKKYWFVKNNTCDAARCLMILFYPLICFAIGSCIQMNKHKEEIGKMEITLHDWVPQKCYKLKVGVKELVGETVYFFTEVIILG